MGRRLVAVGQGEMKHTTGPFERDQFEIYSNRFYSILSTFQLLCIYACMNDNGGLVFACYDRNGTRLEGTQGKSYLFRTRVQNARCNKHEMCKCSFAPTRPP